MAKFVGYIYGSSALSTFYYRLGCEASAADHSPFRARLAVRNSPKTDARMQPGTLGCAFFGREQSGTVHTFVESKTFFIGDDAERLARGRDCLVCGADYARPAVFA